MIVLLKKINYCILFIFKNILNEIYSLASYLVVYTVKKNQGKY